MSRIGRKPIPVPTGVTVVVEPEVVHVTGPRGALSERKNRDIGVEEQDGVLSSRARPTAASTGAARPRRARSWPTWSRASRRASRSA
jgi:ribosomal protein L6P/L9E